MEEIKEEINAAKEEMEALTIEEAFARLDTMIEALEDRGISLEDSFRIYQEGMNLLKMCNEKIDRVEKKILVINGEGGLDEF